MMRQIRHRLQQTKDFYKFVLSDKAKKVFDAYYFDTDVER